MKLDQPKAVVQEKEITYFKLNNEVKRPLDGKIQIEKDKEAVRAYLLEHVNPNTVFSYTLDEKLDYLVEHDYLEEDFLNLYNREFVKRLMQETYDFKF